MPKYTPQEICAALQAEGIQAEPHQLGLAAHTHDPTGYARALRACMRLTVVTMPPGDQPVHQPCREDPMTCQCPDHAAERTTAIKRGRRDVRQPWQPVRRAA